MQTKHSSSQKLALNKYQRLITQIGGNKPRQNKSRSNFEYPSYLRLEIGVINKFNQVLNTIEQQKKCTSVSLYILPSQYTVQILNKHQSILWKFIKIHQFSVLQQLFILGIRLKSIQFVAFLDSPQLKQIICQNNCLNSLKSLSHNRFDQLKKIEIGSNYVKQMNCLYRFIGSSQSIDSLVIDYRQFEPKKLIVQDLSFSVKLINRISDRELIFNKNAQRIYQRQLMQKRFEIKEEWQ